MKLIRLTTEDNKAKFNVNFDTDIKIEKNSKIALHSTSFEVDNQGIEIQVHNNRVEYRLSPSDAVKGFELDLRTITPNNFGDFFVELTNKLNAQLVYQSDLAGTSTDLGIQLLADVDPSSKKVFVEMKKSLDVFFRQTTIDANVFRTVGTINFGDDFFGFQRGPENGFDATSTNRIESVYPVCKGCGVLEVQLGKIGANTSGSGDNFCGISMGFSTSPPQNWGLQTIPNIKYQIIIETNNSVYKFRDSLNGAIQSSTDIINQANGLVNLEQNDIIQISLEGDGGEGTRIKGRLYQHNLATTTLFNVLDDAGVELYPFVVYHGEGGLTVSQGQASTRYIKYDFDRFVYDKGPKTLNFNPVVSDNTLSTKPNIPTGNDYFEFRISEELRSFFTFKNTITIFEDTQRAREDTIIQGLRVFNSFSLATNFYVELQNINIMSYDGFGNNGSRKNILAVIPKNDGSGVVEYESNTPYFISMDNIREFIRTFKAQIFLADGNPINVVGQSTLTLLID
tara:strand:+ start:517 stop:2046 length:1530 start_codon:yes stop_codon:yes gene_type:complete